MTFADSPAPSNPYLANPPVEPGENAQLPDQAASVIRDWAATRTFTSVPWEGVMYTPKGQPPLSNREKAAFERQCQDQIEWYNNEFVYHKLGTESGIPKIKMAYKGPARYFEGSLEKVKDAAAFQSGACGGANKVAADIKLVSGDASVLQGPTHPLNLVYTYVRHGIDAIDMATLVHYADPAAASVKKIRYNTYIYIESTQEVWWTTYKVYSMSFADRADSSLWVNKGIQTANYDAAVAIGSMPSNTVLNVGGVGIYVNDTGSTATFSFEWQCRESKSFCFIACAGGNANSSIMNQYLTATCMKQLHEVGHVLGLGHGITKGSFASPMSGSPDAYPANGAHHSYAQALVCYLHKSCLGVSNIATDYNSISWTWSNLKISPSNDGSKFPVLTGKVVSSNQSSVPLLGVFVQFAIDKHEAIFNGYTSNHLVASLIRPDGTFSVSLDHAYSTGDFVLDAVFNSFDGFIRAYNLAGLSNKADLSTIPLEHRKWTVT